MATPRPTRERIKGLKARYDHLRVGKSSLLTLLDEAEVAESVYNSNAIENSTLTLKETEKILLEMEVSRDVSLREVFEAKNLARVSQYKHARAEATDLSKEAVLLLHRMLLSNINDAIAGRFRRAGEYVRVGTHIAPAPEKAEGMLDALLSEYSSDMDAYALDKIAAFHLGFETIHPFVDGNGRIGRAIINYQLERFGFPRVIIRDKEKRAYYRAFDDFRASKNAKGMERPIALALVESVHKRLAYLRGDTVVTLAEHATKQSKSIHALINAARRQTIPAFREKGAWKIGNGD